MGKGKVPRDGRPADLSEALDREFRAQFTVL